MSYSHQHVDDNLLYIKIHLMSYSHQHVGDNLLYIMIHFCYKSLAYRSDMKRRVFIKSKSVVFPITPTTDICDININQYAYQ